MSFGKVFIRNLFCGFASLLILSGAAQADNKPSIVMFAYDVPVSKHFLPLTWSIFNERFKRVACLHPEFKSLRCDEQAKLLSSNTIASVALHIAKLESCATGSEQLQYAAGQLDDQIWERDFAPVVPMGKLKKLTLSNTNDSSHTLPNQLSKNFARLVQKISHLVTNDVRRS